MENNMKLKVDESMSDNVTTTIIDENGNYFEYHLDEDRVFIFNRYDEDCGEEIFNDKANEIRKFALSKKIISSKDILVLLDILNKSGKDTKNIRVSMDEELIIEILSSINCDDLEVNFVWRNINTKDEILNKICNLEDKETIKNNVDYILNEIRKKYNLV